MDLKELIKKDVCIHCKTEEESKIINELIVKEEGRSLHHRYKEYNKETCYYLNDFPYITFADLKYFKEKKYNTQIILASDIIKNEYYSII